MDKRSMFAKGVKCLIIAVALMGVALFCSCDHGETGFFGTETLIPETPVEELIIEADGCYSVFSPEKKLKATICRKDSIMTISLDGTDGKSFLGESTLGMTVDGEQYYNAADMTLSKAEKIDKTYESNGNQRVIRDYCVRVLFTVNHGVSEYYLELKVFEDGIAYRYIIPDCGETHTLERDTSTFRVSDASEVWYGINSNCGEAIVRKYPVSLNSDDKICTPITIKRKDGSYVSLMQSEANESYGLIYYVSVGDSTFGISNSWEYDNESHLVKGDVISSWKLINVADCLNDLVNNYNIMNVCEEPDKTLFGTDWVKPGRCTWAWGSTYDTATLEDALDFTTAASKLGYEYNLNDYNWRNSWGSNEEISALSNYGKSIGVEQFMIWEAEWIQNESLINSLVKRLSSCGVAGIKLDLWDRIGNEVKENTVALQRHLLKRAAESEMLVLFHGCSTGLGWQRTYPNEISREGIYGAEWLGSSTGMIFDFHKDMYAGYLTGELFTRYLSGPADFTPTCTSAMEIASMVCVNSPLLVNMSPIDQILDSPAVEMIKSIPSVWDRTKVISNSEIGSFAVFAKENKGTWFLGGIASKKQKGEEIHLDEFLGDGGYFMEMWVDTQDGTMERSDRVVTADDVLRFDEIAAGGGFVCRFSKVRLSQYGGAITGEPITAESVGESTVKYTTDGSDPSSSNTASVYSGEIKLRESCLLRIAVTEGDGQGTELSYRYNYITERISLSDETQSIGNYDFERFTSDSESVGFTVHVNDGATLKSVSVYGQKFSAENASLNMKIFKWNSEYESSVSAAPMFAGKAEIIKTGVPIYMDLGEGMPGGDYLIVIGPSEGSLNCGIQTRAAREESHVGETFVNGVRTDIGIKGSIDIAWPNGYPVNEPERQRFVDLFTAHAGSSMGERHSAYNLAQTGETVATMFAVLDGEKLKKIVVTIPSWFDDKGTITFKVFKWNENYFSTVGNDPVKEQVFDGYRDNSVVTIFFENGLQAGDYLFVACDAHDSKSSGVGIYLNVAGTDKRFKGTFINGKPDLNRAMECSLTLVDCN